MAGRESCRFSARSLPSSRLGFEQQLVDVRAGAVQLRSGLRQRLQRSDPIAVRRVQTRQIQAQRPVRRVARRSHIGHAGARQLPLDSNGGDCLPFCSADSANQLSVSFVWGSKSQDSSHAGTAKPMPESPAWARRSNHWIDNAFLGDGSPGHGQGARSRSRRTPGCEVPHHCMYSGEDAPAARSNGVTQ